METKHIPAKRGICEYCKDEYDEPQERDLFKLRGRLMCGDCCNEAEGDREFYELAYGVGE